MPMIALLAAASVAAPATPALPGGLAPFSQGKVMCVAPDKVKKTCMTMIGLRRDGQGGVRVWGKQVVGDIGGLIVSQSESAASLKGDAFCDTDTPAEIDAIRYTVGGAKATPKQLAFIRSKTDPVYRTYQNKEVCQQIVEDAGGMVALARVNGVQEPKLSIRFVWVAPKDGYHLGY